MEKVITNARLKCLRPALRQWTVVNRKLGRAWSQWNDVPWWYNERASLSVLAGAVWQVGGAAFEEYSEVKRTEKRLTPGRIDMWFSTKNSEFWAEAKFCEIPFTKNASQAKRIGEMLAMAKADVHRCAPDGGTRRLALLFGSPYLRPCSRDRLDERIHWLLQQALRVEHDAIAWSFPRMPRMPKFNNWISPGTILWIKEVRRSPC